MTYYVLSSGWNLVLHPARGGRTQPFVQHFLPTHYLAAFLVIRSTALVFRRPLFDLIMAPKPKSGDAELCHHSTTNAAEAGNSELPKRRPKVLPLSQKLKVLEWIRKKNVEVAEICSKHESFIRETVKEEKEIHASFAKLQKFWPQLGMINA